MNHPVPSGDRSDFNREGNVTRIHAPTAIFTTAETVYGIVYRPVNEMAKAFARLAGSSELTAERRVILERDIGFKVELRQ